MAVFKARYNGTCEKCRQPVTPGQLVSWSRRSRGVIYHAACLGDSSDGTQQQGGQQQGGESQEGSETQQQQGSGLPVTDVATVEAIAGRVAKALDVEAQAALLGAIDKRLSNVVAPTLTIKIRTADGTENTREIANPHYALKSLVYLLSKRQHAYLFGPPGSGKSTGAVQAARALGVRYGYCSLNPQTPESRLLGFVDAGGTYRATEFYRCYTEGGVFCADEVDNAHPALLNTLNGMLESDDNGIGRGAFPCGVVERHPDFVFVGTGNTNGRGGDRLFPERRALDSAFLERFAFVAWGYDTGLEAAIVKAINAKHGAKWMKWVHSVREYVTSENIRLWASPRAVFNGAKLLADSGWETRAIADAVLFKGLDNDTVERVLRARPLPTFPVTE